MRRLKVGIRVDDDIRTVQLPITALTLLVVLAFLRAAASTASAASRSWRCTPRSC